MAKFLTPDEYEEVDAFTETEVAARIESERQKWIDESSKDGGAVDEWKKKYEEKEAALADLSTRYDKRSDEYKNAKKELDRRGTEVGDVKAEKRQAFEKIRDSYITKTAGADKEYEDALRAQFERVGSETLDVKEIETSMRDAHALAITKLNRDFTPFNMGGMTGEAPTGGPKKDVRFSDGEGKATADYLQTVLGFN